jgi:hypothetical protein
MTKCTGTPWPRRSGWPNRGGPRSSTRILQDRGGRRVQGDQFREEASALVDLFTVTLRRVMWRGGNTSAEMKVYITTTVNFGDKKAGCIAIAAAREMASMCEEILREAAWFLKN